MLKEIEKNVHSTYFEGMTSIRSLLRGIDSGINNRKIINIYFDPSKLKKISKDIGYLKAVSEHYNFSIKEISTDGIDKIAVGTSHGGLIAEVGERTLPHFTLASLDYSLEKGRGFYTIIDGIEDPYNFGYAIRSLYACGCDGVILGERNWTYSSPYIWLGPASAKTIMTSSGNSKNPFFISMEPSIHRVEVKCCIYVPG